jgi:6-phosphogluconate dehydrogenase
MEITVIGSGKMGSNIARRLARSGHRVVAHNRSPEKTLSLAETESRVEATMSIDEVAASLASPRAVWIMVPAGSPTQETIDALLERIQPGDTIIDGGNSNYRDTLRRLAKITKKGLHFVDVGTRGGIWGLALGYSMMVGGEKEIVERLRPIFETLAPEPE